MIKKIQAWFRGWYLTLDIYLNHPELYRDLRMAIEADDSDFVEVSRPTPKLDALMRDDPDYIFPFNSDQLHMLDLLREKTDPDYSFHPSSQTWSSHGVPVDEETGLAEDEL